eukprot:scaffold130888_cov63-Phaeocystis_antarctica.AAC.3
MLIWFTRGRPLDEGRPRIVALGVVPVRTIKKGLRPQRRGRELGDAPPRCVSGGKRLGLAAVIEESFGRV